MVFGHFSPCSVLGPPKLSCVFFFWRTGIVVRFRRGRRRSWRQPEEESAGFPHVPTSGIYHSQFCRAGTSTLKKYSRIVVYVSVLTVYSRSRSRLCCVCAQIFELHLPAPPHSDTMLLATALDLSRFGRSTWWCSPGILAVVVLISQ